MHKDSAAVTILTAPSQADAARMFPRYPRCIIFPGEGVEIMETLCVSQTSAVRVRRERAAAYSALALASSITD